jgi:hypothetical protein
VSLKVGCWVVTFGGGEKCDEMVERRLVIYDQKGVRWLQLGGWGGGRCKRYDGW